MKDKLLFIPFMIFKKFSILFMWKKKTLIIRYEILCWENVVLHMVYECIYAFMMRAHALDGTTCID